MARLKCRQTVAKPTIPFDSDVILESAKNEPTTRLPASHATL